MTGERDPNELPQLETALDPDAPICDPHHHLYPEGSPLHGRYLTDDLARDVTAGHRVLTTVYVETSGSVNRPDGPISLRPVGETEWVRDLVRSNRDSPIGAIIGFADLMLGERVRDVLEQHAVAGDGLFRGVRFRTPVLGQPEAPRTFVSEGAFRAGAVELNRMGLLLEVVFTSFDQLPALAQLARELPSLRIVLDHLGTPTAPGPGDPARKQVLTRWRAAIAGLAACENVTVKLGGIGMARLTDPAWLPHPPTSAALTSLWQEPIEYVIDTIGPDRCMFESNFPIDRRLCDYVTLWNVYKRVVAGRPATERARLLHDTAVSVFEPVG